MGACDFGYVEGLRSSPSAPFFLDQFGRALILHGVNVSGTCKLPSLQHGENVLDPGHDDFYSEQNTFVGRPFPLKDAKNHFTRLQYFGITIIRFVITWEAVETAPGIYDQAYLQYLRQILQIASDVGHLIVLDFHQDCWSRFTGGSGAPLWTLDIVGLAARQFAACGAALVQKPDTSNYAEPGTLWATNYTKFAVNTMFTLFFGGEVFAPNTLIDGQNVGVFLRRHYFGSIKIVLESLAGIRGIVGVDAMNEPHHGFIGLPTLQRFNEDILLHLGDMPSALQSMRLAAGMSQEVAVYSKSWPRPTTRTSTRLLNPSKVTAWKAGAADIWREHGVWTAESCKDDYFAKYPIGHPSAGAPIDFTENFYVPFLEEFTACVKSVSPNLYVFLEPVPNTTTNLLKTYAKHDHLCYAPHWYDLQVLFEKSFSPWLTMNVQALSRGSRNLLSHTYIGYSQAIRNYTKQYASIFEDSPNDVPRLVGETGIPFDMNSHYMTSTAQGTPHDYKTQESMMDIMCSAMERNLLSYTLWNYTPENKAYGGGGDIWNGEDFSLYCDAETAEEAYAGARAPRSWIRPCATKIAGLPIRSEFELRKGIYHLTYEPAQSADPQCRTTEIFIPHLCSPFDMTFHGVSARWHHDIGKQTIHFVHEATETPQACVIEIQFSRPHHYNSSLKFQVSCILACIVLVLAILLSPHVSHMMKEIDMSL